MADMYQMFMDFHKIELTPEGIETFLNKYQDVLNVSPSVDDFAASTAKMVTQLPNEGITIPHSDNPIAQDALNQLGQIQSMAENALATVSVSHTQPTPQPNNIQADSGVGMVGGTVLAIVVIKKVLSVLMSHVI